MKTSPARKNHDGIRLETTKHIANRRSSGKVRASQKESTDNVTTLKNLEVKKLRLKYFIQNMCTFDLPG